MQAEAAQRADFSAIRYAQCWEDADILVAALEPGPGKRCLSICSAGDNTLALLARSPEYVLAIDLNPAQLVCLELRVAAYRNLQHNELLCLIGATPCQRRLSLYRACRPALSSDAAAFWDDRPRLIENGIGSAGKFERYFRIFRRFVIPLIHSRKDVAQLLQPKTRAQRSAFYNEVWNNRRWRTLFRIFFSRPLMGMLGRDPEFFRYVQGTVADRILDRTRYALTELDPAQNPYIHWILTERYGNALPFALREENFESIRRNLDRLEWRLTALEGLQPSSQKFDCFNLSDIFEYMSPQRYERELERIVALANPAARLAYWNMLAPRSRPQELAGKLRPLTSLSADLFARDQAFFYSAFVVEQVVEQLR
jgi:S-adenosylmethionine-diacylglycerol 3-amino-3-carboxypropyl transferase